MEGAMETSANELKVIEPSLNQKMGAVIDYCFSKNSSNSERFADCIVDKNKKAEELMKSLEFKLLFYSKAANACLATGKTVADCREQTTKGIRELVASTKLQIDKL
jgi:hypothetical protein